MSRCVETKKVRYGVRDAAIEAAFRLLASGRDAGPRPVNVYRCAECEDWHVGHRPRVLVKITPSTPELPRVSVEVERDRCACHCKKLARESVDTPRGRLRCCERHAKQLKRMYSQVAL